MQTQELWNKILGNIGEGIVEIPTTPKNTRQPVWFSVSTDGSTIYVDVAKKNIPSSKLTTQKKLVYRIFESVYPLYLKREEGIPVSKEISHFTIDQVYYYSVIKHFGAK